MPRVSKSAYRCGCGEPMRVTCTKVDGAGRLLRYRRCDGCGARQTTRELPIGEALSIGKISLQRIVESVAIVGAPIVEPRDN